MRQTFALITGNTTVKLFIMIVSMIVSWVLSVYAKIIKLINFFGNSQSVETYLNKRYKLESNENYDEFLEALGVGVVKRQLMTNWIYVFELGRVGDVWTMSTKSLLKSTQVKFKLGEEFDEELADGVKVKSVITIRGIKMYQVMKVDPEVAIVRKFGADQMVALASFNGITCKRIYKAL